MYDPYQVSIYKKELQASPLPELRALAQNEHLSIDMRIAAFSLLILRDNEAISYDLLRYFLSSHNPELVNTALCFSHCINHNREDTVKTIRHIYDTDASYQALALRALGACNDESIIPECRRILQTPGHPLRTAAIAALGGIHTLAAESLLAGLINSHSGSDQIELLIAASMLAKLGHHAGESFLACVLERDDADIHSVLLATVALASLAYAPALTLLRRYLRTPVVDARWLRGLVYEFYRSKCDLIPPWLDDDTDRWKSTVTAWIDARLR